MRTVVFRGFLPGDLLDYGANDGADHTAESCLLCFVTVDDRSSSDERAAACATRGDGEGAAVELCWWLDEASVQFRVAGRAVLADAHSAARACARHARASGNGPAHGTRRTFLGASLGAPAPRHMRAARPPLRSGAKLADAHFAVLIVAPEIPMSSTSAVGLSGAFLPLHPRRRARPRAHLLGAFGSAAVLGARGSSDATAA